MATLARFRTPVMLALMLSGCAGPDGTDAGVTFSRDGAELGTPNAVTVSMVGWGRGALEPLAVVTPKRSLCAGSPCLSRLEYDHGPVLTWWRTLGYAAQQGWTVRERDLGEGPLALSLGVDGARVDADGARAWLVPEEGAIFRVSGLQARDALGRPLPVGFDAAFGRLLVLVNDQDAAYPLDIDPLYTTAGTTLSGPSVSSAFGYSVASAGDVNGDGYGDVIVGAPSWSANIGRVYVYHGSASGVSSTAATTITGAGTSYYLGASVSGAGDVNNDGYDDVVIGASGASSNAGKAYVHTGAATGISTTAARSLSGPSAGSNFGHAVAGGGDFNGDGYDDIAIGAYGCSSNTGCVYVYSGSSSGIGNTQSHLLTGPSTAHQFGRDVAVAGDVNNDTYDDLLVGSPGYLSETGAAYVFHGSGSGVSTVAATSLYGVTTSNFYGWTVDGAGDVNGDGYDDIVVGAYGYLASLGRVEVYQGGSGGIPQSSTTVITGSTAAGEFGRDVAGAGDIDGDGYDDVLVSTDTILSNTGSMDVFYGDAAGLSSASGGQLTGASALDYFGNSISGAGDVDDDGYDDIVVGARGANVATGSAYVYHGYADEDGDGTSAIDDCDDLDPNVNPGAVEVCDSASTDEDCDGLADDADSSVTGTSSFWPDDDNDGFGDNNSYVLSCVQPAGTAAIDGDCNDADAAINNGAQEVCDANNTDEDCDRAADDADSSVDSSGATLWYADDDGDRYGAGADTIACDAPQGYVADSSDCDDTRVDVNPSAVEVCDDDDRDENCNGVSDDDDTETLDLNTVLFWYYDRDSDGYGDPDSAQKSCDSLSGTVADSSDCDDTNSAVNPGGTDDCADPTDFNCDGSVGYADADADGHPACLECDDADGAVHPDALEVCDAIDNNCDGLIDDEDPTITGGLPWYPDADGDGYGDVDAASLTACLAPSGYVADNTDCDDGDLEIHPGAPDGAGGVPRDCTEAIKMQLGGGCSGCSASGGVGGLISALALLVLGARRRQGAGSGA